MIALGIYGQHTLLLVIKLNTGTIICYGKCSSGTAANFAISFGTKCIPACVNLSGDNCFGCVATVSKTQITTSVGGHGGSHWNNAGTSVSYICIGY